MSQAAVVVPTSGQISNSVFARMSVRTKGTLLLGLALLAAAVAVSWLWASNPSYRVLFTNLSDRDGGAIIAQLAQMNIPYRNGDGGVLLVPSDKVHEARLKLAAQGLPKGSVVGFEILENQKFGVTQFQEQLNYQRGLEGELARSISSLAPVAGARVHLALPKQSSFLREKQTPTASVVMQLHPGKALDRQQIAGIVHLVSSSVPELSPRNVSIVDQRGSLLSEQGANDSGLDAAQLDYVSQIEAATIKRIEDILAPIVGRGNVRAQVTADVDFAQVDNLAETYKPNQGADAASVRSTSSSDSVTPGASGTQGVPGAASNQPPVPATAPINGPAGSAAAANTPPGSSTRREAVTNYEIDKNVRHTRQSAGQIKRLSAAVIVNSKPGATAKAAPIAWSEKELAQFDTLVREAMGFSTPRGDSLKVVNAAFSPTDVIAPVEVLPIWKQADAVASAKEVGKALLLLLITLIVVFGVVRPAIKSIGSAPPMAQLIEVAPEKAALPIENAIASPLDQMRQIAKNDPATVANVVKSWVADGKPS